MARAGFWAIESHAIRFGRDGRWYADDQPIANRRIADLFSRSMTRGADGDWWLVMGDERVKVAVEDTPFVVVRVDGDPEHGFEVGLNDGLREPLDIASLQIGQDGVLACDVKQHGCRARFLRPAQAELLTHVEARDGSYVLPLPGGAHREIGRADAP